MRGTIVVDEVIFPIVGAQLIEGQIVFFATKQGPHPGYPVATKVDMVVYGQDGRTILRTKHEVPAVPEVGPDETMSIRLPVSVDAGEVEDDGTGGDGAE